MHSMLKKDIESIRRTLTTLSLDRVAKDTGIGRNTLYDFLKSKHDTGYRKLIALDEYIRSRK